MVFESELCRPRVGYRWCLRKPDCHTLPIPLNAGIDCAPGARPGWYLRFVASNSSRGKPSVRRPSCQRQRFRYRSDIAAVRLPKTDQRAGHRQQHRRA